MADKKASKSTAKKVEEAAFHFIVWEGHEHRAQIIAIVEHYLQGLKSPVQLPLEWLVDSIKAGSAQPHDQYGVPTAEHQ